MCMKALLIVVYVIFSSTAQACQENEKAVGYENNTVELMLNINVSKTNSETYQVFKINEFTTNILSAIYNSQGMLQGLIIHDQSVESTGNASAGNLSFRISSMNTTFEGVYILRRASKPQENVSCIELILRARPNPPVISTSEPDSNSITGLEDNNLTLVCRSTGGYPKPTMAWYRSSNNSVPLATNTNQPQFENKKYQLGYTFRALRADDGATFVCQSSYDPPDPLYMQVEIKLNLSLKPSTPLLSLHTPLRENSNNIVIANCSSARFKPETARLTLMLEGSNVVPHANSYPSSNDMFSVTAEYTSTIDKTLNGRLLTCIVNHTALETPLRAQQNLNVQFAPETAVLSGVYSGIVADVKNKITLTCTAGSSNPPSNITWYMNNTTMESNSQIQQIQGKYNGHVTSQELVLEAVRAMDGVEIFCEVHNVVNGDNHLKSQTTTLDLKFHPMAELSDGGPVVEGQEKTFRCNIQSKPESLITWYHHEANLSTGIETNYIIPVVNRSHAGTYRCVAVNGYLPNGDSQTNFTVHYTPDVEVTTTNVTVKDSSTQVRCSPSGIPAEYTFLEWQHIWPGVGPVLHKNELGTRQTLNLSQLTYEYSGIYNCSVSNGIHGSLNPNAGYGVAYLQVETYPIITADGDFKVPGHLNKNTTATIAFYSNVKDHNVECFIGNSRHDCSAVFMDGEVNLPLFDTVIQTSGTLAHISFSISSVDQFGVFNIRIGNIIGYSERAVEVIPEGPPQIPEEVSIEETQSNAVILSWVPGFHGGFNQTFVIEYSTDGKTWLPENMIKIQGGLAPRGINGTVSNLHSGTLYYMRLMSRNEKGSSNYTRVFNVTTDLSPDRDDLTGNNLVPAIAGGVAAAVAVAVALVVFVLARRRYRQHADNDTEQSRQSFHEASIQDDSGHDGLYATPMKKKAGNKVQEKNKKKEKKEKKAKKDKRKGVDVYENVHELNSYGNVGPNDAADYEDIYENRDDTNSPKSPKRNLNKDGLLYADLEFTNDTKGQRELVIHGVENATDYIQVDFTKKADPLPHSDGEDTQP